MQQSSPLNRVFATLAGLGRLMRRRQPASMSVLLHRPGLWSGVPGAPDYGYMSIQLRRMENGQYEVGEQPVSRHVVMGQERWRLQSPLKVSVQGLSFAEAIRSAYRLQEDHLREIDEAGRRIWSVPYGQTPFERVAQKHGVATNPFATLSA